MSEFSILPPRLDIREVALRDGFQHEDIIPTSAKLSLVNSLSRSGAPRIEIGSFVHPRVVPQMADIAALWRQMDHDPQVRYSALVPNMQGANRAVNAGITDITVVISASDTHNKKNLNRSTDDSLDALPVIAKTVADTGGALEVLIATAWGCPYEGEVPHSHVLSVAWSAVAAGATSLTFADSTGMATPTRVENLILKAQEMFGDLPIGVHLHNTRGTALANAYAAMLMGITRFDTAIGGLGGNPDVLGATGLLATEELAAMAEDMGVATGIDLEALLDAASYAQLIVGKPLPSNVLIAGPRTRLEPADTPVVV